MLYGLIISLLWFVSIQGEGFAAGTLIWTKQGLIPIEAIQLHDHAMCADVHDGSVHEREITHIHQHETQHIYSVLFDTIQLRIEGDQRFYVPYKQYWSKVVDLVPGDAVLTASGVSEIQAIHVLEENHIVYDLTVEEQHTFFVSEEKILTHNVIMLALPAILFGGGFALAEGLTLANLGSALLATAVCALAQKVTGRPINVEIGADGTLNGQPLPFSDVYRAHEKCSYSRSESGIHSSNGGGGGCPCSCGCLCMSGYTCNCSCGCKNRKILNNNDGRKRNTIDKQDFFRKEEVRNNYEHVRDGVYRLKKGGKSIVAHANYLQWDHLHSDVEVYRDIDMHLGSLDPADMTLYKGPRIGRRINL